MGTTMEVTFLDEGADETEVSDPAATTPELALPLVVVPVEVVEVYAESMLELH
jgi:hypothetical protein